MSGAPLAQLGEREGRMMIEGETRFDSKRVRAIFYILPSFLFSKFRLKNKENFFSPD